MGSSLKVMHGTPQQVFTQLISEYSVDTVFTNRDYEPSAIARDSKSKIEQLLQSSNIQFRHFKDQVIFEQREVTKDDGLPYTVYTPYSKKWKEKLNPFYLKPYPTEKYFRHFIKAEAYHFPSLTEIGFEATDVNIPSIEPDEAIIGRYNETRDYPGIKGTSRLSVHLRFGTISIRQLAARAAVLNGTYLNELIWREFYMMILFHFPYVVNSSFKKEYDLIQWRNDEKLFEKWKNGLTGIPIVDAGMRELKATGYMHNRVRMIVASFLTKNLLIDWRWGEAWFAEQLLDFDLAANSGGWQWSAGCGCDAAPYFRVFNPVLQTEKFDPELKYVRKWVPEFNSFSYPRPIIDLKASREQCLQVYGIALKPNK